MSEYTTLYLYLSFQPSYLQQDRIRNYLRPETRDQRPPNLRPNLRPDFTVPYHPSIPSIPSTPSTHPSIPSHPIPSIPYSSTQTRTLPNLVLATVHTSNPLPPSPGEKPFPSYFFHFPQKTYLTDLRPTSHKDDIYTQSKSYSCM